MSSIKYIQIWTLALLLPVCSVWSARAASPQIPDPNQDPANVIPNDLRAAPPDILGQEQEPLPPIDKRLVGWYEAGTGTNAGRVGNQLRANWIMISDTDGIDGQVIGATSGMSIFLLRNGFVVTQTISDDFGGFRLEGLTPGPYTVAGYSPEGMFAFGFIAMEHVPEATGFPTAIRTQAITGAENNRLISKIIQNNAPAVKFRIYGAYDIGEGEDDPAEFYGLSGLKNLKQPAIPATTIQARRIPIQSDGRLVGRIHQIDNRTGRPVEVQNTQIIVIQDGQIVAETQTDSLGVFDIPNLLPGSYGIIATGGDGFGAIGIDLVIDNPGSEQPSDTRRQFGTANSVLPVGYRTRQDSGVVDLTLTDPESIGWLNNYIAQQNYLQALNQPRAGAPNQDFSQFDQMPFDYFSYGGGGGGPGGGLGNFGELFVPLGIVAIIIGAEDSTTSGGVTLPMSPFFP